jgi:hypothetical protein
MRRTRAAGAVAAFLALAGCGSTAATHSAAQSVRLATGVTQARVLCAEAQREIEDILRHGVDPTPTVLPTEIPRTARESLPVIDGLILKLGRIGGNDLRVSRVLRDAEDNRSALEKLARRHVVAPESGMRALYASEVACFRPGAGN